MEGVDTNKWKDLFLSQANACPYNLPTVHVADMRGPRCLLCLLRRFCGCCLVSQVRDSICDEQRTTLFQQSSRGEIATFLHDVNVQDLRAKRHMGGGIDVDDVRHRQRLIMIACCRTCIQSHVHTHCAHTLCHAAVTGRWHFLFKHLLARGLHPNAIHARASQQLLRELGERRHDCDNLQSGIA